MENYIIEDKGIITLGSKVMVSDPCYGLNTWCQGVLENVLPGIYRCEVVHSDEGDWGVRVAEIRVTNVNYAVDSFDKLEDFDVGVDSGTAGIFDYEYYARYHTDTSEREHVNEHWYHECCDKTDGYVINPNYVSFLDLVDYKVCLMGFRGELNELKKKYPELDVDTPYEREINHYHELVNDKLKLDLSDLLETLRELSNVLSKDYKPVEKTEGEKALSDVEIKYSLMLGKLWENHRNSECGRKEIYRSTGNTIDGLGFVSSSGYGDGFYNCWTAHNEDDKVVGIAIEFIGEDEKDEDD